MTQCDAQGRRNGKPEMAMSVRHIEQRQGALARVGDGRMHESPFDIGDADMLCAAGFHEGGEEADPQGRAHCPARRG